MRIRAREAGTVKILGVFDLERTTAHLLATCRRMVEQGFDIDNASVNYRGVMVPSRARHQADHRSALPPSSRPCSKTRRVATTHGSRRFTDAQVMTRD